MGRNTIRDLIFFLEETGNTTFVTSTFDDTQIRAKELKLKIKTMINIGFLGGIACVVLDYNSDFSSGLSGIGALLIGGAFGIAIGSEAQKMEDIEYNRRRVDHERQTNNQEET